MITIKDVAKQAGVSIASVSNYINNKKNISAKTARTIQQAIDDLELCGAELGKRAENEAEPGYRHCLPRRSQSLIWNGC